jgi:hypothetical protein
VEWAGLEYYPVTGFGIDGIELIVPLPEGSLVRSLLG